MAPVPAPCPNPACVDGETRLEIHGEAHAGIGGGHTKNEFWVACTACGRRGPSVFCKPGDGGFALKTMAAWSRAVGKSVDKPASA